MLRLTLNIWSYFSFFLQCPLSFCTMADTLSSNFSFMTYDYQDFPGGSDGKASAYNAGDLGSNPGLGRSPGEGNGNPYQYSCLENPMDRRAW